MVRVQLEKYHCQHFEVECLIPSTAFNREAFLADIKDITPKESDIYRWHFGSKNNPGKQHADMMISFLQDAVRARIIYHRSELDASDQRPPYMEDCANWLGEFTETSDLTAQQQVLYLFEEHYSPIVNLPFPLLSMMEGSDFEGAQVTGIAIRLAGQGDMHRITIDRHKNDVFISFCGRTELNLRGFQLENELEKLMPIVTGLVRETKQA